MIECSGHKFILNGELQPVEMFDKSLVYEGESVYEVLRISKGSPIFFADHMERLATSVRLQKREALADVREIKKSIISLTRADRRKEANIKIIFNYNKGIANYLLYFIESSYPTESQYTKGVRGILFKAERKDPESKVIDHRLRSSIYHRLIHEKAYEAILVNENDEITEGSRSNIFFQKGEVLFTAPDSFVLSGITRKHILSICSENGIKVNMSSIKSADISSFDSVFMTGTSPMVLPFSTVDNIVFSAESLIIRSLRKLYVERAEASMKQFRGDFEMIKTD